MSKLIDGFNETVEELKADLYEGLVAADLWHRKDAQSLNGYNS